MNEPSMLSSVVSVPRISPVDGPAVARLLLEWLRRPTLQAATLITFGLSPFQSWVAGSEVINSTLCRTASQCDVTLMTSDADLYGGGRRGDERLRGLEVLRRSGVRVLVHHHLHAKVYLLEEMGRQCWIVGSSNLTPGGFADNVEVNVRGYHEADFAAVATYARELIAEARPF